MIKKKKIFIRLVEISSRIHILILIILLLSVTACEKESEIKPKIANVEAEDSNINTTSALLKGEITDLGNMKIVEYGIEISESMLFTTSVSGNFTTPASKGIFQYEFTGLKPVTIYYYRAYVMVNTARLYPGGIPPHFTTKN